MAKAQIKKAQVQAENAVFALDIGTRSIIGMVGVVEDGKVRIVAIDKEEHTERAMVDGQIENIDKVTALANKVKKRLEEKDKRRRAYYKHYADREWGMSQNYHLSLDSSLVGVERCAQLILDVARNPEA